MPHIRETLRDNVIFAIATGATTAAGARVYDGPAPTNLAEATLPAVYVETPEVVIERTNVQQGNQSQRRTVQCLVTVIVRGSTASPALDQADDLCVDIEALINTSPPNGTLDWYLLGESTESDLSGDQHHVAHELNYVAEYMTLQGSPIIIA